MAPLDAVQRHQRERRAVLLVIVEQGKVPPRSVFLLQSQQDVGQLVLERRPAALGKQLDARAPRSSGQNKKNSPLPGTTIRAGWAACVRCRARGFGRTADRATFPSRHRSSAGRPTAAWRSCKPASGPRCRRAGSPASSAGISCTRRKGRKSRASAAGESRPWPARSVARADSMPACFASCKATSTAAVTKLRVDPLGFCVWALKS